MGYVYFGVGATEGRVTIGATQKPEERIRHYKRADPDFRFHKVVEEKNQFACEHYLHRLYASRRLLSPGTESWFALELDEIDHAVRLWRTNGEQHLQRQQRVELLKKQVPRSAMRAPRSEDHSKCARLREVKNLLEALTFEKDCLEAELKLSIELSSGIEGLATWKSRESLRFNSGLLKAQLPHLYERFREPIVLRYLVPL